MNRAFYRAVMGANRVLTAVFAAATGIGRLERRGLGVSEETVAGAILLPTFALAFGSAVAFFMPASEGGGAMAGLTIGGMGLLWPFAALQAITAFKAGRFDDGLRTKARQADGEPWANPQIGERMPDGTVYAGLSPDSGKPMYAAPADAPLTMRWTQAMGYAARLEAHGHKDWQLPSRAELDVLFNNRAAIGGFDTSGSFPAGYYWSSSEFGNLLAWIQRFNDGTQDYFNKRFGLSVRCVRR